MSKFTDPTFIEDGYSRPGFIAAVSGLHDSLSFTFRPLLPVPRSRLLQAARDEVDDGRVEQIAAEAAAKQLESWSLTHKGDVPKITADTLLRLHPALWSRLYQIVIGSRPSDPNPDWEVYDEEELEDPGEVARRALEGGSPGEPRQDDLGN